MDVGLRYALRWAVRQRRTWLAVVCVVVATWLASRDQRTGWTVVVAVLSVAFAMLAVVVWYGDAHPDRTERLAHRERARVDAIVNRFDGVPQPAPPLPAPVDDGRLAALEERVAALAAALERREPAPVADDGRIAALEGRLAALADAFERARQAPPPPLPPPPPSPPVQIALPLEEERLAAAERRVEEVARALGAVVAELGGVPGVGDDDLR